MTTTILTDTESIERAEPALDHVGGHWDEHFIFPLDPELVFQRTGYACLHEIPEVPQTFMDGENAYYFYDFDCIGTQFPEINCHLTTGTWPLDCNEALEMFVGRVDTAFKMDRVAWDEGMADQVRGGESPDGVDLQARVEGVENNRLVYRYIPEGDCSIEEECVGAAGWRRVLLFDASLINRGTDPLHLGDPDDLAQYNMFEYSACHDHQHFRFYGDFDVTGESEAQSDKKAFCLQSTRRYNNNEHSPLSTKYDKCQYQGIGAGWGDDYGAGLDCQWVDVTDFDYTSGPIDATLSFVANKWGFLCEGKPVLGDDGNPVYEDSGFTTVAGDPIYREKCDFLPDYDSNNSASADLTLPDRGGYMTSPCTRGQLGPLRDCGFTEVDTPINCTPGAAVNLTCSVADGSKPQYVRICERSAKLDEGTACIWRMALAGGTVGSTPLDVNFTCPAARDADEPGGTVSLYTSPALDTVPAQTVTCD